MRAHAILVLRRQLYFIFLGEKKKEFYILFNFESKHKGRPFEMLSFWRKQNSAWRELNKLQEPVLKLETLEDHRLPTVASRSQSPFQFPGIKYLVNVKSGFSRWLAKAYEQLHLSKEGFSNHRPRGGLWHWGKFQTIFEVVWIFETSIAEKLVSNTA